MLAGAGRLLAASFTPETDLTGEGVSPVPGEPGVYTGGPSGPLYLMEAAPLDEFFQQRLDDLSVLADEDGVVFTSPLIPVNQATVDVTVTMPGLLDAWIDFDKDGVWAPHEQIFASLPLVAGLNSLIFNVPPEGPDTVFPLLDKYAELKRAFS